MRKSQVKVIASSVLNAQKSCRSVFSYLHKTRGQRLSSSTARVLAGRIRDINKVSDLTVKALTANISTTSGVIRASRSVILSKLMASAGELNTQSKVLAKLLAECCPTCGLEVGELEAEDDLDYLEAEEAEDELDAEEAEDDLDYLEAEEAEDELDAEEAEDELDAEEAEDELDAEDDLDYLEAEEAEDELDAEDDIDYLESAASPSGMARYSQVKKSGGKVRSDYDIRSYRRPAVKSNRLRASNDIWGFGQMD